MPLPSLGPIMSNFSSAATVRMQYVFYLAEVLCHVLCDVIATTLQKTAVNQSVYTYLCTQTR